LPTSSFTDFRIREIVKTLNTAASRRDVNTVYRSIQVYGLRQVLVSLRFVNVAFVHWIADVINYYYGDVSRPVGAEVPP
jgi:hypothetical protein